MGPIRVPCWAQLPWPKNAGEMRDTPGKRVSSGMLLLLWGFLRTGAE